MLMFAYEKPESLEKLTHNNLCAEEECQFTPFSLPDQKLVRSFHPVSLEEMEDVRLMNRIDVKYMLHESRVPKILEMMADSYQILEISGSRTGTYETVYYDNHRLGFFLDHINGKLNRNKVRTRLYVESDLQFLEVKKKINTGRTKKIRIRTDPHSTGFDDEAIHLVLTHTRSGLETLSPVLVNRFNRITLIDRERTERVTIDLNLQYAGSTRVYGVGVPRLAIIEIKRNKFGHSIMADILRNERVKQTGISKYCLGISLIHPGEKVNNYKRKNRIIEKITQLNGLIA